MCLLNFKLAKRLSDKQKKEIIESFTLGKSIEELSKKYNFTIPTISRNLKKLLGENKFKELSLITKSVKESNSIKSQNNKENNGTKLTKENPLSNLDNQSDISETTKDALEGVNTIFTEIAPLNIEFDSANQQDLSSVPISEAELPKVVYMVVDKKIELEIKLLKDFPEWEFLPHEDLNRKTIEIFFDLNLAKRSCNKEQKVLKVPNTDVFRIAAPVLLEKGISRIVCAEILIAL